MSRCPLRISPKPGTQAGGKAFTRGLWLTTEPGAPGTKLKQGSDMATQQELVPGSRLTVRFLVQAMLQLAARSGRTRSSSSAGKFQCSPTVRRRRHEAGTGRGDELAQGPRPRPRHPEDWRCVLGMRAAGGRVLAAAGLFSVVKRAQGLVAGIAQRQRRQHGLVESNHKNRNQRRPKSA